MEATKRLVTLTLVLCTVPIAQAWMTSRVILLESTSLHIPLEVLAKSHVDKQSFYEEMNERLKTKSKILATSPGMAVQLTPEQASRSIVQLECISDYPATWVYEGPSEGPGIQTVAETRREFSNISDIGTYRFVATAKILHPKEKTSGKYTCKSLIHPATRQSFHLFVAGPEYFISTLRKVRGRIDDQSLVIPCPISHLNHTGLQLELFQMDAESDHPEKIHNATFDPTIGFIRSLRESTDYPWGQYVCTCKNASYTNSITIDVDPPPETKARATIKGHFVRLMKNIKQLFVCEAKTNVTFYFSSAWSGMNELLHPATSPITFSYEASSEFPFSANMNADPREFGNFALIHCVDSHMAENLRQIDLHEAVLHTWEYSSRGSKKNMTFTYHQQMDAFICCTMDSFTAPVIQVLPPCDTFQECLLRYPSGSTERPQMGSLAGELQISKDQDLDIASAFSYFISSDFGKATEKMNFYADPTSIVRWKSLPSHCTARQRYHDEKFAIIRCSIPAQPGIPLDFPSQEFIYANVRNKHVMSMEELANAHSSVDIELYFRTQRAIPGDVLKVRVGDRVVVKCSTNNFVFSNQKYLAFQRDSGIEILATPIKPPLIRQDGTISKRDTLNAIVIPDDKVKAIHCLAPLWFSLGWRNATVEISASSS